MERLPFLATREATLTQQTAIKRFLATQKASATQPLVSRRFLATPPETSTRPTVPPYYIATPREKTTQPCDLKPPTTKPPAARIARSARAHWHPTRPVALTRRSVVQRFVATLMAPTIPPPVHLRSNPTPSAATTQPTG